MNSIPRVPQDLPGDGGHPARSWSSLHWTGVDTMNECAKNEKGTKIVSYLILIVKRYIQRNGNRGCYKLKNG